MRALLALIVALATVGCYHDKYNVNGPKKEEYILPPNQDRFDLPPTAEFRPPPAPKQQDTLMGGKGGGGMGGGRNGGLGGF